MTNQEAGPNFAKAREGVKRQRDSAAAYIALNGDTSPLAKQTLAELDVVVSALLAAEKLVGEQRQEIARLRQEMIDRITAHLVEIGCLNGEIAQLNEELSRLTGPREPSLPVPDMAWPEWLEWQADLMEAWKPGPDPIGPLHGAGMATAYTGLAKHYRSEAARLRKQRASREPSP